MKQKQQIESHSQIIIYALVVVLSSYLFSCKIVAVHVSENIRIFSAIFIPTLTIFLHLLLLSLTPFRLYVTFILLDAFVKISIATYSGYFAENVDLHTLFGNLKEGEQVASAVTYLIPFPYLLTVIGLIFAECFLARQLQRSSLRPLLLASCPFVIVLWGVSFYKISPDRVQNPLDYDRIIRAHGYYSAMFFDLFLSDAIPSADEIRKQIERQKKLDPPKLLNVAVAKPHPYKHLLIIQVESLDYKVVLRAENGKAVTPFLNELRNDSIFIQLEPFHNGASGTSASDFQLLVGNKPLTNVPAYKAPGIDYGQSLPALLKTRNIPWLVFYGAEKTFWSRLFPYKKMGITKFYDIETFDKIDTRWGISDKQLLERAKEVVEALSRPTFVFIMTLSSHVPYDYVKHEVVFPETDMSGRYFNSIRYTDAALANFFSNLKGNYLVIIYGDHGAGVKEQAYSSNFADGEERIPAFIFVSRNGTIEEPKLDGELTSSDKGFDIRTLNYFAKNSFP